MPGPRGDHAGTALASPAQRPAMGVGGGRLVAENVVEPVLKSLEHMFGSVRRGPDALQDPLQRRLAHGQTRVLRRRSERRPDVELRAHAVYDGSREVRGPGRAAQIRGLDPGADTLERRLVDRP